MLTAEQILRAAAEELRTHGWTQGVMEDEMGRHCMTGALIESDSTFFEYRHAKMWLCEVIGGRGIVEFNDLECTSADDAIAALEIAADLAA